MSKLIRLAGYIWAAPLTALGLVYVLVFSLLGWYKSLGRFDDALTWCLVMEKAPKWLNKLWTGWGAHTIGNVVVLRANVDNDKGKIILRHEQEHVRQYMILGIFWPVFYFSAYLGLKFCRNSHPYYDNPFEIDARRAAGQAVDVIGALRRAVALGKIKLPPKGDQSS